MILRRKNKFGKIANLPTCQTALGAYPGITCTGCGHVFRVIDPFVTLSVTPQQIVVACSGCMVYRISRAKFNKIMGGKQ